MIMRASNAMMTVFAGSRIKSPVKQATSLCPYGDACSMTTDQWYPGGHVGGLSLGTMCYTHLLHGQNSQSVWVPYFIKFCVIA